VCSSVSHLVNDHVSNGCVCCIMLQCVAVCCSMLQYVAVRCSVLQCVAEVVDSHMPSGCVCCKGQNSCRAKRSP